MSASDVCSLQKQTHMFVGNGLARNDATSHSVVCVQDFKISHNFTDSTATLASVKLWIYYY